VSVSNSLSGMPKPIVRTERSARSRNNSRVQWALPDDLEEEQEEAERQREREREEVGDANQLGASVGADSCNAVGSVGSNVGQSSSGADASVRGGYGRGRRGGSDEEEGEGEEGGGSRRPQSSHRHDQVGNMFVPRALCACMHTCTSVSGWLYTYTRARVVGYTYTHVHKCVCVCTHTHVLT